jgi:CRISPR-associated endonuclease/helicase Cas3
MLDTAAVAREVLHREPARTRELYARDLGLDVDTALPWVCALAGLHDLGKASPAFQRKWTPGATRVREQALTWSESDPPADLAHGLITQWALEVLLNELGWTYRSALHVADAVGCHHGFRATSDDLDIDRREHGGRHWDAARKELLEAVLDVLGVRGEPPALERLSGAAFMRMAGLTSFADWIGSSLPFAPLNGDLSTYYRGALERARAALDAIGWHRREPLMPAPAPLETVFAYLGSYGRPFRARPLQTRIEALVKEITAPTLLLIEAPMGEGKTEAAFYAHLHLEAALGHRGMYVALPTQASGNMMFTRTLEFLNHAGSGKHLDLQLLHGATLLNEQYQSIAVRGNVPEDEPQAVAAREWFSHKKRALLSEYGVGTVDQALLSVLNVKHQFVRLWGLANRTVVIDEVHAYDTYTSGLIATLVRWLHSLDSSVVVMSATLPGAKRRELLEAFGAQQLPEIGYPRITRVSHGRAEATTFEARPQPTLTVRQAPAEITDLARLLAKLTQRGGCAACIVNTVQRAQALYRELQPSGIALYLFHARYTADERQRREEQVIQLFGKDGANRPERAILVATQVVEQSLDLDFDVMVTDLAPIDLVLQRAGRLHRHDRPQVARRGHTAPVLYVAGMQHEGELPELGKPHYFDAVYERYVLLRTWAMLKRLTQVEPPGDIDRLVQTVYSDDGLAEDLSDDARKAFAEAKAAMDRDVGGDQADSGAVVIGDPLNGTWETVKGLKRQAEDDAGYFLPVLTRKGEESANAVPLYVVAGGYVLDPEGARPARLKGTLSIDEAKAVYMRSVRLSRPEVVRGLKAQLIPRTAWRENPLLRDCYPLVLEGMRHVFGKTRVAYAPELGIVYERVTD